MKNRKIAIVTGAAKGIGKAISSRLADDGCFVCGIDIDDDFGMKLVRELGKESSKYYRCDIQNEDQVKELFQSIIKEFNKINILINNAGIIYDNLIINMSLKEFENVINVNLKGTWLMCREAANIMKTLESGRIINISSRALLGNPGQSNYSASKAGIIGLTRSLALELGRYNIFVNAVAPGLIDTPLTRALPSEVREKLIQAQPTKNIGKPEDVANVVAFLANERTRFITGQTIYVDGGKSIGANS
jgi:NAD(P)-dependent dehydrogenase (short-subunit alcohol dehydrogenase family)